jgi:hypothetical protein
MIESRRMRWTRHVARIWIREGEKGREEEECIYDYS